MKTVDWPPMHLTTHIVSAEVDASNNIAVEPRYWVYESGECYMCFVSSLQSFYALDEV